MEIVHPLAEAYAAEHTSLENELLQTVRQQTLTMHPHAHMLSGLVQGRFLAFISQLVAPKYILEIGTFTGYSALCLAEGLREAGELHTIELREEDGATARKNFSNSLKNKQIHLHIGNAREIIPTLSFEWDLVFIDADKTSYQAYYDMVLPTVKKGGLIVADNVLFHGQVLAETVTGKNAKAINEFNKYVANDNRVEQVMVSLRDGLLLIKKKG